MTYTPEQLAAMSDGELNKMLANLIGPVRDYCTDWAATGPLMFAVGITKIERHGHTFYAEVFSSSTGKQLTGPHSTPLRAVVECLVLVLQEGE